LRPVAGVVAGVFVGVVAVYSQYVEHGGLGAVLDVVTDAGVVGNRNI
jgi:hypothetical protein